MQILIYDEHFVTVSQRLLQKALDAFISSVD